MLLIYLW